MLLHDSGARCPRTTERSLQQLRQETAPGPLKECWSTLSTSGSTTTGSIGNAQKLSDRLVPDVPRATLPMESGRSQQPGGARMARWEGARRLRQTGGARIVPESGTITCASTRSELSHENHATTCLPRDEPASAAPRRTQAASRSEICLARRSRDGDRGEMSVCVPGDSGDSVATRFDRSSAGGGNLEDLLGGGLEESFQLRRTQRQAVLDADLLLFDLVWVVHRVQDTFGAEHLAAELDAWFPCHAARRIPDILLQIVADLAIQRLHDRGIAAPAKIGGVHVVHAVQPEWQRLAEVADNDL